MQSGYWKYLITVVAMLSFAIGLQCYALAHDANVVFVNTMVDLGIAAAAMKTHGIVRWLAVMTT